MVAKHAATPVAPATGQSNSTSSNTVGSEGGASSGKHLQSIARPEHAISQAAPQTTDLSGSSISTAPCTDGNAAT